MRITVDKGLQPIVQEVMQQIRTNDPRAAVNYIISSWAASQNGGQSSGPAAQPPANDEFSSLADWS